MRSDLALAGFLPGGPETGADATFYAVIAFALLVPWALLGLTLVGHLHAQWTRKAGSRGMTIGRELRRIAGAGRRGNPWVVH